MWDNIAQSWPIIPLSVAVGILFLAVAACLVALLYDAGARDTGRVTQFGIIMLGLGIVCCAGIGFWNLTVSIAKLRAQTYASTAQPDVPPQER